MTSIMTNTAAMAALHTLRSINNNMEEVQARISSGYRVETAADNAAYWSIATTMRSDNAALSTVQDALGLGAFAATGASLALSHDSLLLVVTVGVVTGIGGGVLRDIFVREIPLVFRAEIYAVAAAIGAACFYGLQLMLPVDMALYLACLITVAIRLLSLYYGINLPRVRADKPTDKKDRGQSE